MKSSLKLFQNNMQLREGYFRSVGFEQNQLEKPKNEIISMFLATKCSNSYIEVGSSALAESKVAS